MKKKCKICGVDISMLPKNSKYCGLCGIGVTKLNNRKLARKRYWEQQETWNSMSKKDQIRLMDKVAKTLLQEEEKNGRQNNNTK